MGRRSEGFSCQENDCWMCVGGRCRLLTERPDEDCGFKKTQNQVDAGRRIAHEHLTTLGEYGQMLIRKFEHNPQRAGMW